jgi:hypothetical protein
LGKQIVQPKVRGHPTDNKRSRNSTLKETREMLMELIGQNMSKVLEIARK